MAKALLIAEKPSLMRDIYNVYKNMKDIDDIDFMAFSGHVMTLAEPGDYKEEWGVKKWNWDMLPIIPNKFKCKVSNEKRNLFEQVKRKLETNKYDYLINACDPDREAQMIFEHVKEYLNCKLPTKRYWSNDTTEISIEHTLRNLRDNDNEPFFKNLTKASRLRGQLDWLIGMNLTVASSLKMGTCKVGRVKTPTLKILVDRELEIKNFKPSTSYELEGIFDKYSGTYFDKDGAVRLKNKTDFDEIIKNLSKESIIESIEKKVEKENAPLLYSLNSLQIDANKMFGYDANETLAFVQSLYEKKILSYPRTDNPYISSELAKKFPTMLKAVQSISELKEITDNVLKDKKVQLEVSKNKRYIDDKKMAESGHYAIIPTGVIPNFNSLTKEEINIFITVCKRFLSIFLPPMKSFKTTIVTNSNNYKFKTTGKTLIDRGYTILYNKTFNNVTLPDDLKEGDKVNLMDVKFNEKITTPPPRFTDGSLVATMENPIKFLNDKNYKGTIKAHKGIGTTATRAGIIEELVKNGYIEKKKGKGKTNYIYATDKGISIIENLDGKSITSVDLTAIWESRLDEVEKGKMEDYECYNMIKDYVLNSIDEIKSQNMKKIDNGNTSVSIIGKCPCCGKDVKEGKSYYLCSSYKNGCDFIIPKQMFGAKITKTEVKKILAGKETKEFSFKNKTKEWKCKLVYSKEEKKVVFANSNNSISSKNLGKCPVCGKPIKEGKNYYMCEGYKNGCNFIFNKEYSGTKLSETDVKTLLSKKKIRKKFKWKSGKIQEANLVIKDNKVKFDFS